MHSALLSWQEKAQPPHAQGKSHHYVLFRIARQNYALPLIQVTRVLRMVAITPVPEMPDWLSGIINMAGQTITVIDLRCLLGQKSREPELQDRLLIIASQQQTVAVAVDEVLSIQEFTEAQVEPPSPALSQSRVLAAIIRQDDAMIMVLDAERLFFERLKKVSDGPI
ncbi:MAG: purine-binding chemotaxis protein CheW [Syntrophaceae bacterium]|nr:MAG: purine-binding chemotaxis protein CheW [Syntrophaceae bacterium]